MKKKILPTPSKIDSPTQRTMFRGRGGLGAYTTDPASFPQSRVVYYNDKFVVINDLFPKASIHLLILPRDPHYSAMRGQEAFDDPEFLAECREEEIKVRAIVAEELRRRYEKYSVSEQERLAAMSSDDLPDWLPPGRIWTRDVISGTHANPSMSHLHIHVLSKDLVGEFMRKRNHYQSFTTDFLIGMDQYPLPPEDHRRRYSHFPEDMFCWRCGENFGNKMEKLREHLKFEFEEWKRD